jgi:hypothetical protein
MKKYHPESCPKCGTAILRSPNGGRPTRWCCDGCKISGEAEMGRLSALMKKHLEGLYYDKLNRFPGTASREALLAEMQARYDHLAGVPPSQGVADSTAESH